MDDSQNLSIQNGIPNSNKSKLGLFVVVVVMITLLFSNLKNLDCLLFWLHGIPAIQPAALKARNADPVEPNLDAESGGSWQQARKV
jgi:hypothetical protein